MNTVRPRSPKVEIDFTDAQLTDFGGWSVLGRMSDSLGLPRALSSVSVKQRAGRKRRGDAVEPDRLSGGGQGLRL